jgi:hypothetical protein
VATLRKLVLAVVLVLLTACAHSSEPPDGAAANTGEAASTPAQRLACTSDAQCVVKNIGNCCGYFPACVHRDQPVDPLAVQRRCAELGMQSICGFAEIAGCACVDSVCKPIESQENMR